MNIMNYGMNPINYIIIYCTSSDPNFPIENINKKRRFLINKNDPNYALNEINSQKNFNCGWSSVRYCSYPQEIIIQLNSISDIKQINIEINHERIPQKIDVFVYSPSTLKEVVTDLASIYNANYTYIGSVIPINHNENKREIKRLIFHNELNSNSNFNDNYESKKIPKYENISIKNCLYVKFILHKNYKNPKKNKFEQIGIINIEILGTNQGKILPTLPLTNVEYYKSEEDILPSLKYLYRDEDYEKYIYEKITRAKKEYYSMNNNSKEKIYNDIQVLRELGRKVIELKKEKIKYGFSDDNEKINMINIKLNDIKKYIEEKYPVYGNESILYDDENDKDVTKFLNVNMYYDKEKVDKDGVKNKIIGGYDEEEVNVNEDNIEDKSNQILMRHLAKKKMIEDNIAAAKENIKIQEMMLHNKNVNM